MKTTKILATACVCALLCTTAKSQLNTSSVLFSAPSPEKTGGGHVKGDKILNVGIGVNSFYSNGIPFGASFEVGITDDISVGGSFDYLTSKYSYLNWRFTAMYFAARGAYHFNNLLDIKSEKIDLYAGAALGFRTFSWKDDFDNDLLGNSYGSGVYLGAFAGGRYYFNGKIGAFLEVGAIGSTNARVGLTARF
jgi:hypothetical protein